MNTANPLLKLSYHIPFGCIEPDHVAPAIRALLDTARSERDELLAPVEPRTFENTLLAFEKIGLELGRAWGVVHHLKSINHTDALNEAIVEVEGEVTEFAQGLYRSEKIWEAISSYADTEEASTLTGRKKRLLERVCARFKKEGAELSETEKDRLMAIDKRLAELSTRFSFNHTKSLEASFIVIDDESRLAGIPASLKKAAKENAEKNDLKDSWRFQVNGPNYIGVMKFADDIELRKEMHRLYHSAASQGELNNIPLAAETLELRREKAALLGFTDYADYTLSLRMAGNGETAKNFLQDLEERTRPVFEKESQELLDFKNQLCGTKDPELPPWDIAYYAEKLRQKEFDFDSEKLRPYFPFAACLQGAIEASARVFGVRVKKNTELPVWHETVTAYDVFDKDNSHLGAFYVDAFPRDKKRSGGWQNSLISRHPGIAGYEKFLGLIVMNFPPPTSDEPSLLTKQDVDTLWHEFGHLLQQLFTNIEYPSISEVPWDYIELPSQLMENWLWEREALDMFAAHWESGEKIPDDMLEKMKQARNFREASLIMLQVGYSTADMKLHTEFDPAQDGDIAAYARKHISRYTMSEVPEYASLVNSFGHIFAGGYATGYYSYLWASALDADVFERFQEEGLFSSSLGDRVRTELFEIGDTKDVMEAFNRFMGREPDAPLNTEAMLRRADLIS